MHRKRGQLVIKQVPDVLNAYKSRSSRKFSIAGEYIDESTTTHKLPLDSGQVERLQFVFCFFSDYGENSGYEITVNGNVYVYVTGGSNTRRGVNLSYRISKKVSIYSFGNLLMAAQP